MRISAEERPLPPWPTWPLSTTTIFPAFRFARWKAMDAPMTAAPRITMSAVVVLELVLGPESDVEQGRDHSLSGVEASTRCVDRRLSVARSRLAVLGFRFIFLIVFWACNLFPNLMRYAAASF